MRRWQRGDVLFALVRLGEVRTHMHPPPFYPSHRLSDWPDCCLEVRCPCSERVVVLPVRLLLAP